VPPVPTVYAFIEFNGQDIQSLEVREKMRRRNSRDGLRETRETIVDVPPPGSQKAFNGSPTTSQPASCTTPSPPQVFDEMPDEPAPFVDPAILQVRTKLSRLTASCDTAPASPTFSPFPPCASPGSHRSRPPRRYNHPCSRICRCSRRYSRRYSPRPPMHPPSRYAAGRISDVKRAPARDLSIPSPMRAPFRLFHPWAHITSPLSPTHSTRRRGFASNPAPGSCTCRQHTARLVLRPPPGAAPACAAVVAAVAREVALAVWRRTAALAVVGAAAVAVRR
jgi:hypothetical protein